MKSLVKDEVEKQMILNSVSEELESLSETVTAIENMEVGRNISSSDSAYDIALVIDFVDAEALNTYRIHPEHQRVLGFLKSLGLEIAVVDYNF
jgi:acyl-CoA reductase-like NAD-dependent aldehyde dehydrogenase